MATSKQSKKSDVNPKKRPARDAGPSPEASGIGFPLDVAALALLISALLYTAGWSFAFRYFERFHVGLMALELPKEYFFIYSFWVARDHLGLLIAGLLVASGLWVLWSRLRHQGRVILPVVLLLSPLALLGLFWTSYALGRSTAESVFIEQRENDYPDYPRVRVTLVPQTDPTLESLRESLQNGCYRLLLQNKDKVFVFYSLPATPTATLPVTVLPMGYVASLKILPHYNSCPQP